MVISHGLIAEMNMSDTWHFKVTSDHVDLQDLQQYCFAYESTEDTVR